MSSISEQTVLNDRCPLDEKLGRGGMGVVNRAHDLMLAWDVAVQGSLHHYAFGLRGRISGLWFFSGISALNCEFLSFGQERL